MKTIVKQMLTDDELAALLDDNHGTHYISFVELRETGWNVVLVQRVGSRGGKPVKKSSDSLFD